MGRLQFGLLNLEGQLCRRLIWRLVFGWWFDCKSPAVWNCQAEHLDPLANLPDFVDPDEAIVSSWSEADRAGHRLETSSSLGELQGLKIILPKMPPKAVWPGWQRWPPNPRGTSIVGWMFSRNIKRNGLSSVDDTSWDWFLQLVFLFANFRHLWRLRDLVAI